MIEVREGKKVKGYIYKITSPEGRVYVGYKKSETFVDSYWGSSKNKDYWNDLKKFGKENFTREIVDWVYEDEISSTKESYYIIKLHGSVKDGGYNRAIWANNHLDIYDDINKKYYIEDYVGKKYGKWTIIGDGGKRKCGARMFLCQCECGRKCKVEINKILDNDSRGCKFCCCGAHLKKHGLCKTKIYQKWEDIKKLCNCPTRKNYKYFGAKGIKVCEEWNNNFEAFYEWVEKTRSDESLVLDRIDKNGDFSPENCTWVTKEQRMKDIGYIQRGKKHNEEQKKKISESGKKAWIERRKKLKKQLNLV